MSDQTFERIICAAIRMDDGYVIRGHRHNDCLHTASGIGRYGPHSPCEQGFMTSEGRFVSRQTAHAIHRGTEGTLYSEDVY